MSKSTSKARVQHWRQRFQVGMHRRGSHCLEEVAMMKGARVQAWSGLAWPRLAWVALHQPRLAVRSYQIWGGGGRAGLERLVGGGGG